MADTRILSAKPTDLLKKDHRRIRELFDLFEEAEPDEKQPLFEEIRNELTLHAQIEEELFYPALEEVEDEECQELVEEAREEHELVKDLLEELSEIASSDETFDAKMKVLRENVEHHAEEEEDQIFSFVDELTKDRREELAQDLLDRKRELGGEIP